MDLKIFQKIPRNIIKWGIYILIGLFLANSVFGKFPDFIGNFLPFITRSEYRETLKNYEIMIDLVKKNQSRIDSMQIVINERDVKIKQLELQNNSIQATRLKNKKEIKNAKGNIVVLDSLANRIF